MKFPLLLLLILLFCFSCSPEEIESSKIDSFELISQDFSLEIKKEISEEIIGLITDLTTDRHGNIYILDGQFKHVKKYSSDGHLKNIIGNGEGRGPGEFTEPFSVAVDSLDNVYITDRSAYTVTIFKSDNTLLQTLSINIMPARMMVDAENNIYLIGFEFSNPADIIHHYSPDEDGAYEHAASFGERPFPENSNLQNLLSQSGNVDAMNIGQDGHIYMSLWYPYDIRSYTKDGQLVNEFNRGTNIFTEPERDSRGIVQFTDGSWNIIPLSDGRIINQIFQRDENGDMQFSYDLFDPVDNKFLGSALFESSEFPDQPRLMVSDRNDNLYIATNSPEPRVYKYTLKTNY